MPLLSWERTTFNADGLTGERLVLTDGRRDVATVVVWPGRKTRAYWPGGATTDFAGPDSRATAVAHVEAACGL